MLSGDERPAASKRRHFTVDGLRAVAKEDRVGATGLRAAAVVRGDWNGYKI